MLVPSDFGQSTINTAHTDQENNEAPRNREPRYFNPRGP